MRVVVRKQNVHLILSVRESARLFARGDWKKHANRGVIDAGRRTKTQVQRAVARHMALRPGNYSSYVVAGTRGVPRQSQMAYEIFGVKGGQRVEIYKGLRVLARRGEAAGRFNAGRAESDSGMVKSGVWNAPRVFKRSFATGGGFFAMLPARLGVASRTPKAFWTYGRKPDQPRDALGRFARSGKKYGRVRRLYGPSLMKEIPKDVGLATFQKVAPAMLEQKVVPRVAKLLKF